MKPLKIIPFALLALPLVSTTLMAAPPAGNLPDNAAAIALEHIPPSKLKTKILSLPPAAQENALKWLNSFSFPAADYASLRADNQGGIFYEETVLPEPITQAELEANPNLGGITENTDVFTFHSKPGATNKVYVNFKGFVISGTGWNSGGLSSYNARPFDKDGDSSTFSIAEKNDIATIWQRISEDLAPFDIDVTTEAPDSFGAKVGHILITRSTTADNKNMPYSTSGGVAYVGAWGYSNYEYYQPALVYYNNLASHAPYISEAASHELGHNLALSHDGTSTVGYYTGHGTGVVSWAPIMGVGYYNNVTQWSKGEYAGANNTQDDLAIIANRLNYRNDDNIGETTALLVDAAGNIASSNPEFDPDNQRPENKGIIETSTDSDMFYFDSDAGSITLTINPAWDAFTRSTRRGANLDIEATLYNEAGDILIITDPNDETNAVINIELPASGRYFLKITGVGNDSVPYSDYGSLGQYYISGKINPLSTSNEAPIGVDDIATTTENNSVDIDVLANDTDANNNSLTISTVTTATNGTATINNNAILYTPNTGYTGTDNFQYTVSDGLEASTAAVTVTVEANAAPTANNDNVVSAEHQAVTIDVLANDTDANGDSLTATQLTTPANGSITLNNNIFTYTPDSTFVGNDNFDYTVSDGITSDTGTVTINVLADANKAPVAVTDTAEVLISGSVTIDVLANDSDPEGSALTISNTTDGSKGSVTINSDNTLTYQAGSKRGGDSFTYTISDGDLSSTTTVNISIVRTLSGDDGDTGGGTKCHPKRGC